MPYPPQGSPSPVVFPLVTLQIPDNTVIPANSSVFSNPVPIILRNKIPAGFLVAGTNNPFLSLLAAEIFANDISVEYDYEISVDGGLTWSSKSNNGSKKTVAGGFPADVASVVSYGYSTFYLGTIPNTDIKIIFIRLEAVNSSTGPATIIHAITSVLAVSW